MWIYSHSGVVASYMRTCPEGREPGRWFSKNILPKLLTNWWQGRWSDCLYWKHSLPDNKHELYFSLCLFLSVSLTPCLPLCLFPSFFLPTSLSTSPSLFLSPCLPHSPVLPSSLLASLSLSPCLSPSFFLPTSPSLFLSLSLPHSPHPAVSLPPSLSHPFLSLWHDHHQILVPSQWKMTKRQTMVNQGYMNASVCVVFHLLL